MISQGASDNPKCNAFAIFRGAAGDVDLPLKLPVPEPAQEEVGTDGLLSTHTS